MHIEPILRRPAEPKQNQVLLGALCQACQGLWANPASGSHRRRGLDHQRATVINVDRQASAAPGHRLARPAAHAQPAAAGGRVGWPSNSPAWRGTIAYIQGRGGGQLDPPTSREIWAETYRYLYLRYLTFKLTGRFADSVAARWASCPSITRKLRWASHWDWK